MADDDVQLTDLEVIQRYSLAVAGPRLPASWWPRLQADLAGCRRAAARAQAATPRLRRRRAPAKPAAPVKSTANAAANAAAKAPAKAAAPAPAKTPAKKAPAKAASTKRNA
jgi:hypothetical protein